MHTITVILAGIFIVAIFAAPAHAGPVDKARNTIDPDCSVGKAVKGAAQRATIGVGNRCKPGKTARDTAGMDGNDRNKNADREGPIKRR